MVAADVGDRVDGGRDLRRRLDEPALDQRLLDLHEAKGDLGCAAAVRPNQDVIEVAGVQHQTRSLGAGAVREGRERGRVEHPAEAGQSDETQCALRGVGDERSA